MHNQRPVRPYGVPTVHSVAMRRIAGAGKPPRSTLDLRRIAHLGIVTLTKGRPLTQRYLGRHG